jgi:ferredoxin
MQPTGEVAYQSQGRVLVIGEQHAALQLARKLAGGPLQPAVLVCGAPAPLPGDAGVPVLFGADRRIRVEGHLGAFRVLVEADGGEIEVAPTLDRHCSAMDLVVDLRQPPLLDLEMLPPGYYAPADASAVERVVAELPELVGEFVKPRYFRYDPEICAHGRSGLSGCRRCLDACPAGAIVSLRERIEVDPQLCQGGGACATACPTGAIVYAYPGPRDMGNRLRVLLRSFREAGGEAPILLFHDGEAGAALLAGLTGPIPARVLPVEVEEVGSVGLELWFASLAHGAARVLLLDPGSVPPKVRAELRAQLATADTILSGLGYPPGAVALLSSPDGAALTEAAAEELMPGIGAAGFAGSERKRDTLFLALDHLIAEAGAAVAQPAIELAEGAPFGEIQVDPKACTLCLSCVSVCPASALADGVDQPLLALVEANCVQCGLCEIACPENAITRHPRLLLDPKARSRPRTLHRELAFHCVKCGAPFATASVVTRITEKLTGHRMFQDPEARRRLQMCGDCRVKDLLQHERDR